ncbi:MAG TPA: AAA family ATPase [Oligoflexia bacterium]|nr:AAA family ATPase [Oligoflexia bacterium]HMP49635.1 AAA family ATPase [Oligoflexia bacterium]
MKILVVEQDDNARNDIIRRVEEAARRTSLKSVTVFGNTLADLGSFNPELLVIGPFARNSIEDVTRRLEGIFPRVPLCLLLGSEDYVSDAIDIRRRNVVRVVALGDLPQIAQVIMDAAHGGRRGGALGPQGRVVTVVQTRGGVGASSTAVSLGYSASRKRISTAIVDLGVVSADISRWAGVGISNQAALRQLYEKGQASLSSLKEILVAAPGGQGNLFVIGEFENYLDAYRYYLHGMTSDSPDSEIFDKLIDILATEFELVILDIGGDWGIAALSALALSTHVLLVVDASGYGLKRSFETIRRMSIESDDPFEFDFRKWSVVLNNSVDSESSFSIFQKISEDIVLPNLVSDNSLHQDVPVAGISSRVFPVFGSKKGKDWFSGSKTLYELSEESYQKSIDSILFNIFPSLV